MSGNGKTKIISISKIKKINVILKNRMEKGTRPVENNSNPHSKDDIFSLSLLDFFIIIKKIIMITIKIITHIIKYLIILFTFSKLINWKLIVLNILIKLISSSINESVKE